MSLRRNTTMNVSILGAALLAAMSALSALSTTSAAALSAIDCPFSIVAPQAQASMAVDSLLMLRHSISPTFPDLNNGATAIAAATTRDSIVAFSPRLDVDGDGRFDVRDAQIIARYVAGFRGEALVSGLAVPALDAKRPDATGVLAFINAGCPAPSNAADDPNLTVAFHDVDGTGASRRIRNDLTGGLSGMVEIVQSHSVNPSDNDDRAAPRAWPELTLPDVVTHRGALLLFTPSNAQQQVTVIAQLNGVTQLTAPMQHPNALPRADFAPSDGRAEASYSRRAWSVELPWNVMKTGLTLTFVADGRISGTLAANQLRFAAPAEVLVHNVQVGMLTDAPSSPEHALIRDPASFGTDYFQTLPAARLTVSSYEPVRLPRVMLGNGASFENVHPTSPDVYGNVLFNDVAERQVRRGIHLANHGIPAAAASDNIAYDNYATAQHTALHSQGNYNNGVVQHGQLGGGGMVAVLVSRGNEFSHEIGHSFGMDHWPGARWPANRANTALNDVMDTMHHADSGWGYIAHRKRMRANLQWSKPISEPHILDAYDAGAVVDVSANNFAGLYHYNRDAMSSAEPSHAVSKYTHYTGYTAVRIQRDIDRAVADLAFPSGYKAWDSATSRYVNAPERIPGFSALRPERLGVPVHTIVGVYDPGTSTAGVDPDANLSLLYTPLRGNYGHVFALPAPDFAVADRQCWLEITFAQLPVRRVAINATRLSRRSINAVSVNIAQSDNPRTVSARCRLQANNAATETILSSVDFVAPLPMAAATRIGMEDGFSALRAKEIVALNALLEAKSGTAFPLLSAADQLMFDSWSADLTGLGDSAKSVAQRLLQQRANATDIARYINTNRAALSANNAAIVAALRTQLQRAGFAPNAGSIFPAGNTLASATSRCMTMNAAQPPAPVMIVNCAVTPASSWWQDARGGIHNAARPDLCLTGATAYASTALTACNPAGSTQLWRSIAVGNRFRHEPLSFAGSQTLDAFANGVAGLYQLGTPVGNNQQWNTLSQSDNAAFVYFGAADLLLMKSAGL
jgi:hypothetical protein